MQNDTERQILEAAKNIFVKKGFAGARMQEIANEANINKSMLHYYFRSKEMLFEKILDDSVEMMIPELLKAISGEGAVMEKLERLVEVYIDTISHNPHIPMFVLNELAQQHLNFVDKVKAKMSGHQAFVSFFTQVAEEQQKGILKPIPPHHLMLTVMSLIVFPFVANPIFRNILEIPADQYNQMMLERKEIVINFLKDGLLV
ncbi:TetR/AcrR family transcriptional regulator [Limibacter armeniacum]|uniref:TetR/AcrR family transcriptional regulator n=1 Tax=Limibacter armeniacum TaxID=466084 RepID=UPI002FE6A7CF